MFEWVSSLCYIIYKIAYLYLLFWICLTLFTYYLTHTINICYYVFIISLLKIFMKKIIALSILVSLIVWNNITIATAFNSSSIKLVHKPFWLFDLGDADYQKNIQLWIKTSENSKNNTCIDGSNFAVYDDAGEIISTYVDEKCTQAEKTSMDFTPDFWWFFSTDEADASIENNELVEWEELVDTEVEWFLNDLFGWDSQDEIVEEPVPVYVEPVMDTTEEIVPEDSAAENDSESLEDIDALFLELFGQIIDTDNTVLDDREFTLRGRELFKTIQAYSQAKETIVVWWIEAVVLEWNEEYRNTIISILSKVDNEFWIDSIKNDFAKNISDLSYSLLNHENTELSIETRAGFKNKIITDINKIERKYKILKRKDAIISHGLSTDYSL